MTPVDGSRRSFVASSIGGWLAIVGLAIIFGPRDVYPEGAPIPMVNGLRLVILPAATIAALHLTGYLALALGLLVVTLAALHRAAARRSPKSTTRAAVR